mmetsp:Transcript_31314/g.47934  ORF Transcript_31314/g.47934 Transcript_31314/m.47934 type:complete len:401 (-) Transcript_31314:579-1781(-)
MKFHQPRTILSLMLLFLSAHQALSLTVQAPRNTISRTNSILSKFPTGCNGRSRKYRLYSVNPADSLASDGGYMHSVEEDLSKKSQIPFPLALWRFTRPHTIIGSALAIPALHVLAAPSFKDAFTMTALTSMVYAMIPSLFMNLYITGLNQITDVEIDKINKPNLPIAAGDMSSRTAIVVVILALCASIGMGLAHPILGSEGLNLTLWGSAILGTMYSLQPFRLKRFPLLAAVCIVAVRGTIINAGFFTHALVAAYGRKISFLQCLITEPKCFWSSIFFGIFGIVIALMKDVPDVRGDALANIRSFSVRMGQKSIFGAMKNLLSLLMFSFGAAWLKGSMAVSDKFLRMTRFLLGVASIGGGMKTLDQAKAVNPYDSAEVYSYYMFLWKLFYISYLVMPFAR